LPLTLFVGSLNVSSFLATMPDPNPTKAPRQCVILVGGLGTRLGALTADCPKPLLPVATIPFLSYLADEAERFGFKNLLLLAGYRSADVEAWAIERRSRPGVTVDISVESTPAGTGGSLLLADHLLEERFLLLNGDSWFDFNWLDLMTVAPADQADVVMALRPVSDGGRYGVVTCKGERVIDLRDRGHPGQPATINAGVYVMSKRILKAITPGASLERDVIPALAKDDRVRGRVYAHGRFIDIGVPDDYARAQTILPGWLRRPAVFLDRDGVLNHDHGYVHRSDQFDWVDGAREAIKLLNDNGFFVFVVTNQAGIARGYYDETAVGVLHGWISTELRARGAHIDDFRYCPHHPEGTVAALRRTCRCRKPGPGMIEDLLQLWTVDQAHSFLVGDKNSDIDAAHAAGIDGYLFDGVSLLETIAAHLKEVRVV
jgi:D,D-heptose 1,7-bisphosphate phosphatase